jgi:hypothetical protein
MASRRMRADSPWMASREVGELGLSSVGGTEGVEIQQEVMRIAAS